MSFKRSGSAILLSLLLIVSFTACSQDTDSGSSSSSKGDTSSSLTAEPDADMFTEEDLNQEVSPDAVKVTLDGKTLTVAKAGEYLISGSIKNGQIIVDSDKNSEIVLSLSGVNIEAKGTAAIYVKKAKKVTVTLADGSENILTSKGEFQADDTNLVDGAIFSKADLVINGKGSATITSEKGHGVVSKDNLLITGGNCKVTSLGHAFSANDSLRVAGGDFQITSDKDGFHAENLADTTLGFFYACGGSYNITAGSDGISASGYVKITGGDYTMKTGGGAAEGSKSQLGGHGFFDQQFMGTDDLSAKGIKSGTKMTLSGGKLSADSADDALHSNDALVISGGSFDIKSGDDAVHAETDLEISGGKVNITESYEGLEATTITLSGGETYLTSSDDGINAAGGNDQSGFGGGMRPDMFASSDSFVKITGGKLCINASGDGIDSNGEIIVSGGETYVSGPTNSGNGAMDFGVSAKITGGIFVAAGASGMAENFSSAENQGAMLVTMGNISANTEFKLLDEKGKEIIKHTFEKAFSSIVISCPGIKSGNTYTLKAGSTEKEIKMTSNLYGEGGGPGGGPDGFRPGGPDGFRPGRP